MGADVNPEDDLGNTALIYAIESQSYRIKKHRLELIKVLITGGADINLIGRRGWTPFKIASYYASDGRKDYIDIVKYLKAHGAK